MTSPTEKVKELSERVLKTSEGKQLYLPFWEEWQRAVPSELVRSALFTVGNRNKRREYLEETPIVVIGDGRVTYQGQELRQEDEDVWLHVLHLARLHPLGEWVEFTPYSFVKGIGWPVKGQSYERLRKCLIRMKATALSVYSKRLGRGVSVSLVRKFEWQDEQSHRLDRWRVWIEPEMRALFGGSVPTKLHWDQRQKLRSHIAKWLHSYYTSHKEPYPLNVETIRDGCGSETKVLHDFKPKLAAALEELKEIGFIASSRINEDGLVWVTRS